MAQVFGCPQCQQKFQVPDDAAGLSFQCPACKFAVAIPAKTQVEGSSAIDEPAPQIFGCPHCHGQFGITPSMFGNELECPHCEEVVSVGIGNQVPVVSSEDVSALSSDVSPVFEEVSDEVVTDVAEVENLRSRAASIGREEAETRPDAKLERASGASVAKQSKRVKNETPSEKDVVSSETATSTSTPEAVVDEQPEAPPEFKPSSVDHLLPPKFDVPDPARFPSSLKSGRILLPDGTGGFQSADANTVTITHNGEVYHLKRLDPQQRQRRKLIHSVVAIGIAVLLILMTLKTLGVSLL